MNPTLAIFPVALLLIVSGCQGSTGPIGRDFGNAVLHNKSVHIINPAPDYAGAEIPDLNGIRAALARERYEKGEVIEPEAIETTEKGAEK